MLASVYVCLDKDYSPIKCPQGAKNINCNEKELVYIPEI